MSDAVDIEPVRDYLLDLQDRLCAAFEALETPAGLRFRRDRFESPGGGVSQPRVLADDAVIEKAAVHWSHRCFMRSANCGSTA